jgi:uncharacterized metal-binding protein (TIGR02443 family)
MSALRRFIAGAKCPACGQLDKLFLEAGDTERICVCVACGFRDVLARDGTPAAARAPSAEPEAVRLIDPRDRAGH